MDNRWTVLGGWSVEPEILQPLFGITTHYLDTPKMVHTTMKHHTLPASWQEDCAAAIEPHLGPQRLLAGWSTGALVAYGCAHLLNLSALVLLSGTPSFCRTSMFRAGTRPSVVASMRSALAANPYQVVNDFRSRSGLAPTADQTAINAAILTDGLHFLEQVKLFSTPRPACPIALFHGDHDTIIPAAAGSTLQELSGGTLTILNGGHACFINNETTITALMHTLLEGNIP